MAMSEKEQVRPLAPAAWEIRSDEEANLSQKVSRRHRKIAICCGCTTAVLLIITVVLLVLGFTVFHVKEPRIHMNNIFIQRLELDDSGKIRTDVNITLLADVSVKNPNAVPFRFGNTTTTIYYAADGTVIGEGRNPAGKAKAGRTLRMNMTVDVVPAKILAVPGLVTELTNSGALTIKTYTKIDGRVKITSVVKKNVEVKLNCTATFNIKSQAIQEQKCKQKVSM